jgi:hypothetical protein
MGLNNLRERVLNEYPISTWFNDSPLAIVLGYGSPGAPRSETGKTLFDG